MRGHPMKKNLIKETHPMKEILLGRKQPMKSPFMKNMNSDTAPSPNKYQTQHAGMTDAPFSNTVI